VLKKFNVFSPVWLVSHVSCTSGSVIEYLIFVMLFNSCWNTV